MRQRYRPGDWGEVDGIRWRVMQGKKSTHDIRLDWESSPGVWVPVRMESIFVLVDILFDAEDIAGERWQYRDLKRFKGWQKFADALRIVWADGADVAIANLNAEMTQPVMFVETNGNGQA